MTVYLTIDFLIFLNPTFFALSDATHLLCLHFIDYIQTDRVFYQSRVSRVVIAHQPMTHTHTEEQDSDLLVITHL